MDAERTALRFDVHSGYNSFNDRTNNLRPSDDDNAAKLLSTDSVDTPTSTLLHCTEEYDPHDYGNTDHPTSFWGTISHLIILSFGPAVLTIPRTFQNCGYVTGFFVTFAIVFLYAYNMRMLVWCEYTVCKMKRVPNMSYADVLYYSIKDGPSMTRWLAPYSRVTVYIIFIVIWFGCTAIGLLLMSQNFALIYYNLFGRVVTERTTMLALLPPMWLLCCIRRLKYLVPFSTLATVINFLSIMVVMYYVIVGPWSPTVRKFGSIAEVPLVAGAVLFNLTATGIIIPLKNEMKEPRKFNSGLGVLTVSYVPVSTMYTILGVLCTIKYGDSLRASVIQNLPEQQFLAQITLILSTVTSTFVYPLTSYIVFDVIWNNVLREKRENLKNPLGWEYVVRTFVVGLTFLGAYTIPNISLFLSLSGTVGTSVDSIILPALMQTLVACKVTKNRTEFKRILIKNLFIVAVALVLMITGVASCVADIITYYNDSNQQST